MDIDGIAWCGDPKKGVLYEKDKPKGKNGEEVYCPYSPVQRYWEEASIDVSITVLHMRKSRSTAKLPIEFLVNFFIYLFCSQSEVTNIKFHKFLDKKYALLRIMRRRTSESKG